MREEFELLSAVDDGVFTTAMADEIGLNRRVLTRAVATGELTRIRHGAYVVTAIWKALHRSERHRLLVIATARLSTRPLVVSHLSALAMYRLPLVGAAPTTVHVLDPGAIGSSSARFITSHRRGPEAETLEIDGVLVTSLHRALVDVAATGSMVTSVAAMDAALHESAYPKGGGQRARRDARIVTRDSLLEELERLAPARGRASASQAIEFADGRAESPGESFSRVRIFQLGFEAPELQVRFHGIRGKDAVLDFHWLRVRGGGEFDGHVKYTRGMVRPDQKNIGDIVWAEKLREDALRRTVLERMARWVWDEVLVPEVFHRLLTEAGIPRARRAA